MNKLTCITLLLIVVTACSHKAPPPRLNYNEVFFSETLASITADPDADSIFYVGTEDGAVFRYDASRRTATRWSTPFERVYKVLRDSDSYWVGARNMGLHKCRLRGDSLVSERQFVIRVVHKASQYSVYDISLQDSGVYVASSHGLLKVPASGDTLDVLAPPELRLHPRDNDPVTVTSISSQGDFLYAASSAGLLALGVTEGNNGSRPDSVTILHHGENISSTGILHGEVVSISADYKLFRDTLNSFDVSTKPSTKPTYSLMCPAQIYYCEDELECFIGSSHIQFVKNNEPVVVELPRPVHTDCHNVIAGDRPRQQLLLVTDHAIVHIGVHQNAYAGHGEARLACGADGKIYYLIGNTLYAQSSEQKQAVQLKDITTGEVRLMTVSRDTLYYVTSDNEVYKSRLSRHYLANQLPWRDIRIPQSNADKRQVMAIGSDERGNVYLGVRDGLRHIEVLSRDILIKGDTDGDTIQPYITGFTRCGSTLLFGTLNDGVFSINNGKVTRLDGTAGHRFIRDVAVDSAGGVHFITNNRLCTVGDEASCPAMGFKRLLSVDNRLYGVGDFGITDFATGKTIFRDVSFAPGACVAANHAIYAGSSSGIFRFIPERDLTGTEGSDCFKVGVLNNDDFPYSGVIKVVAILAILFAIAALALWRDRLRQRRIPALIVKDGLLLSLDEVSAVRGRLDKELNSRLDQLLKDVGKVDTTEQQQALDELRKLRPAVMLLGTQSSEHLRRLLAEQRQLLLEHKGSRQAVIRIHETEIALQNSTLSQLASQIAANDEALPIIDAAVARLADYEKRFGFLNSVIDNDELSKTVQEKINTPGVTVESRLDQIEKYLATADVTMTQRRLKLKQKALLERCDAEVRAGQDERNRFQVGLESIKSVLLDLGKEIDTASANKFATLAHPLVECSSRLDTLLTLRAIASLLPEYEDRFLHLSVPGNKRLYKELGMKIYGLVDDFYNMLSPADRQLLKTLNVNPRTDVNLKQKERLLAVLLAGATCPVNHLTDAVCGTDQNMRLARRQLKEARDENLENLKQMAELYPSGLASLILAAKFDG